MFYIVIHFSGRYKNNFFKIKMTNGSYELNGKSNLGYVNSDSSDMPGAFHINDDNGNTFQTNSSKHVVAFLFFN